MKDYCGSGLCSRKSMNNYGNILSLDNSTIICLITTVAWLTTIDFKDIEVATEGVILDIIDISTPHY